MLCYTCIVIFSCGREMHAKDIHTYTYTTTTVWLRGFAHRGITTRTGKWDSVDLLEFLLDCWVNELQMCQEKEVLFDLQ